MHPTTLTSEAFLATAFAAAALILATEGFFLGDRDHQPFHGADKLVQHAQTAALDVAPAQSTATQHQELPGNLPTGTVPTRD